MERHEHIVSSYEEELSFLNNKVAKMGGLAERVVGQSLDALERRDRALAESTIQHRGYRCARASDRGPSDRYDRQAATGGLRPAPSHRSAPHVNSLAR